MCLNSFTALTAVLETLRVHGGSTRLAQIRRLLEKHPGLGSRFKSVSVDQQNTMDLMNLRTKPSKNRSGSHPPKLYNPTLTHTAPTNLRPTHFTIFQTPHLAGQIANSDASTRQSSASASTAATAKDIHVGTASKEFWAKLWELSRLPTAKWKTSIAQGEIGFFEANEAFLGPLSLCQWPAESHGPLVATIPTAANGHDVQALVNAAILRVLWCLKRFLFSLHRCGNLIFCSTVGFWWVLSNKNYGLLNAIDNFILFNSSTLCHFKSESPFLYVQKPIACNLLASFQLNGRQAVHGVGCLKGEASQAALALILNSPHKDLTNDPLN